MSVGLLGRLIDLADRIDRTGIPHPTAKTEGQQVAARARVIGLADLPLEDDPLSQYTQAALLRLAVAWPDGQREACVRQNVPPARQATLAPGDELEVAAPVARPERAYVLWRDGPAGTTLVMHQLLAWPEAADWPAPGAIEVRGVAGDVTDARRHGTAVVGTLAGLELQRSVHRRRHRCTLHVDIDGRRARVESLAADLGVARLAARPGAEVVLLQAPDGVLVVDWEATIRRTLTG